MSLTYIANGSRRRGRPPKGLASGYRDTRSLLIHTGLAVLTERGYSAVGISEILFLANVPKGSFYHCFASKEAFGHALISAYADYFAEKLDRLLLDNSCPPVLRLRNFVDDAKRGMARHKFLRGCLIGNLGQEMGTLPVSFRTRLIDVLLDWERRTERCLLEAQRLGQVASHLDCRSLALVFWVGWEGAVLRAKLERSAAPLETYAAAFFALLDAS